MRRLPGPQNVDLRISLINMGGVAQCGPVRDHTGTREDWVGLSGPLHLAPEI